MLLALGAGCLILASWARKRLAVAAPSAMPQFGWTGVGEEGSYRSWWSQISPGGLFNAIPFTGGVAVLFAWDEDIALVLFVAVYVGVGSGLAARRVLRSWEGARERLQPRPPEAVFRRYLRAVVMTVIVGSLGSFALLAGVGLLLGRAVG